MRRAQNSWRQWCGASLALCLFPLLASCGEQVGEKLYSRKGSVEVTSLVQLDEAVSVISRTVKAPVQDRTEDLDGNPMYLLSNQDVVIVVAKRFGEACELAQGCRWDYSLSATDTGLDHKAQKKLVNRAFEAVAASRL